MTRSIAPVAIAAILASAAPALGQDSLAIRISQIVDSLYAADAFSGVVLLARNGEPVFQRAWGLADRETARPNRTDTGFNLGSINKAFTQIAVRQLAAQGRLSLDSTLATYWPDYPNANVARRVTIRQLLQHSSGIGGNIFAAPPGGTRADIRHNRDYLQLFVHEPLQFEPGARQQYSNAGYVVLGMLVERIAGVDYYEYVQRNVYEPAGMTRTSHFHFDSLPPNTALGYHQGARNSSSLPGRGSAAGGGYSTAHDLMRFVQALREGKIPQGPPPGIGIAGGAPGLNAAVDGALPGGYDLIVLANQSPPAAELVARRIRALLGAPD